MKDKDIWNNPAIADEVLSTSRGSVFPHREKLRSQDPFISNLLAYICALENCIYHSYSITNDFGIRKKGYLAEWRTAYHKSTIDGRDRTINENYI